MKEQKKKSKELTFTIMNIPSKEAIQFHTEFMFEMYKKGKIKIPHQNKKVS